MNQGAGWIVFEESHHEGTRRLLSILPARRNRKEVVFFLQQTYVDRFASLAEKISYKKHPKSSPFSVLADAYGGPISVGHEPFYVAIYARKIVIRDNLLVFRYRIATNRDDPFEPRFEQRCQSLSV